MRRRKCRRAPKLKTLPAPVFLINRAVSIEVKLLTFVEFIMFSASLRRRNRLHSSIRSVANCQPRPLRPAEGYARGKRRDSHVDPGGVETIAGVDELLAAWSQQEVAKVAVAGPVVVKLIARKVILRLSQ